jgi:hypothetical protein
MIHKRLNKTDFEEGRGVIPDSACMEGLWKTQWEQPVCFIRFEKNRSLNTGPQLYHSTNYIPWAYKLTF